MKRQPTNACTRSCLAPRSLEAAFAPRFAFAVGQYEWASSRCRIERSIQCIGSRDRDISAGLVLAKLDLFAVVGAPSQAQQIALPLSSIDCEQHRQTKIGRCDSHKSSHIIVIPNLVNAGAVIKLAAFGTWVFDNQSAIPRPRKNSCQSAVG